MRPSDRGLDVACLITRDLDQALLVQFFEQVMSCVLVFGYRIGDIGDDYMGPVGKGLQDRVVGIGVLRR